MDSLPLVQRVAWVQLFISVQLVEGEVRSSAARHNTLRYRRSPQTFLALSTGFLLESVITGRGNERGERKGGCEGGRERQTEGVKEGEA